MTRVMRIGMALLLLFAMAASLPGCGSGTPRIGKADLVAATATSDLPDEEENICSDYVAFADGCLMLCKPKSNDSYESTEGTLYERGDDRSIRKLALPMMVDRITSHPQGAWLIDADKNVSLLTRTNDGYAVAAVSMPQGVNNISAFNGDGAIFTCEGGKAYLFKNGSFEKMKLPHLVSTVTANRFSQKALFRPWKQTDPLLLYDAKDGAAVVTTGDEKIPALRDSNHKIVGNGSQYVLLTDPQRAIAINETGAASEFAVNEKIRVDDVLGAGEFTIFREAESEKTEDGTTKVTRDFYIQIGTGERTLLPRTQQNTRDLTLHNTLLVSRERMYFPDQEIKYVIYDYNTYSNAGMYTDGAAALKSRRNISVIDVPGKAIVKTTAEEGYAPSSSIASGDSGKAKVSTPMPLLEYFGTYF